MVSCSVSGVDVSVRFVLGGRGTGVPRLETANEDSLKWIFPHVFCA